MNKNYILLGLVLLVSCAPNEVPSKNVVERDGIKYEVNSQTSFTGISVSSYKDGTIERKQTYKDGKEDGLHEWYHDNGQLSSKVNFKDGKEDGLHEWYHENGQLERKTTYKDGKEDGLYENYHENGELLSKGNLKDGQLHGESYYENGKLESKFRMKDGQLHGLYERYYKNGQLNYISNYKEGDYDGVQENYKNGQLHYISNYKDGKQYGTYIFYNSDGKRVADSEPSVIDELHPNGELSYRMHYQSQNDGGQRHGLSEFFDENGQLTQEINFKDGKRDGIYKAYVSGYLHDRRCYKNDEQTDMSYCEK